MNILISGISGFVGQHLAIELKKNHHIIGIWNTQKPCDLGDDVDLFRSDEITNLKKDPDIIVMCHASISSGNYSASIENLKAANEQFTKQLINQFPNAYVIFLSSISVYGNNPFIINESTKVNPITEYAHSKLAGESIAKTAKSCGILRTSSLFGKNMKENTIIPIFVNQAISSKEILVWGDGKRKQNYISIEQLIIYLVKMIDYKATGVFLAVSDHEISNLQLAELIAKETNSKITFKGEDQSTSHHFENNTSKKKLFIKNEFDISMPLIKYINWKQKQY